MEAQARWSAPRVPAAYAPRGCTSRSSLRDTAHDSGRVSGVHEVQAYLHITRTTVHGSEGTTEQPIEWWIGPTSDLVRTIR